MGRVPTTSRFDRGTLNAQQAHKERPLSTAEMFHSAKPFPHLVMRPGFFCGKMLQGCLDAWPSSNGLPRNRWLRYENSLEQKLAIHTIATIPEPLANLIRELNTPHYLRMFSSWTGINGLQADPELRGAGLHQMNAGDWLQIHGDYQIHPTFPTLERRLNFILFLNPEKWKPAWGGALLLCDGMDRTIKRFYPEFGSFILYANENAAFHGVEQLSMNAPPRKTLEIYYLAPVRPSAHRMRAMFLPNRNGAGGPPEEVRRKGES